MSETRPHFFPCPLPLAAGQLSVPRREGAAEIHLGTVEPPSQLHPGGHRKRHRCARLGHAEHEVSDGQETGMRPGVLSPLSPLHPRGPTGARCTWGARLVCLHLLLCLLPSVSWRVRGHGCGCSVLLSAHVGILSAGCLSGDRDQAHRGPWLVCGVVCERCCPCREIALSFPSRCAAAAGSSGMNRTGFLFQVRLTGQGVRCARLLSWQRGPCKPL